MEFPNFDVMEALSTSALVAIAGLLLRGWLDGRRVKLDESASARTTYEHLVGLLTADLQAVRIQHAECDKRIAILQQGQIRLERRLIALTLRYAIPLENLPPELASALNSMAAILQPSKEREPVHDDAAAS